MAQEVGPISPARLIEILNNLHFNVAAPLGKANIFNTPIAANHDFLDDDLTPTNTPTLFRIYVCLSVAGVFSVQRRKGTPPATVVENLNAGNPILANAAYMFDILVDSGESINFQTTVAAQILKFSVVEKDWVE